MMDALDQFAVGHGLLLPKDVASILLTAAIVGALIVLNAGRIPGFRAFPYTVKPLLTPWELVTLRSISRNLPQGWFVSSQVRLADLVEIGGFAGAKRQALYRVSSKSLDFVVVDERGGVKLVVECDDRSHQRLDRRQRDAFVNGLLAHLKIPMVRLSPGQRTDWSAEFRRLRQLQEPGSPSTGH